MPEGDISDGTIHKLEAALTPWIASARWHEGNRAHPSISSIDLKWEPAEAAPTNPLFVWFIVEDTGRNYNVPLVLCESQGNDAAEPVAVDHSLSRPFIYDAADHPYGQRVIFELATGLPTASRKYDESQSHELVITQSIINPRDIAQVDHAEKLRAEQSNTSIIYTLDDASQIVVKIFRILAPGHNPDVELQQALADTHTVPRQCGSAAIRLSNKQSARAQATDTVADILHATQYLEGSQDGWRGVTDALSQARHIPDLDNTVASAASMRELGTLTREFHTALARVLPVHETTLHMRDEIRTSIRRRAQQAFNVLPALADVEGSISVIYAATEHIRWPQLQRIHGDFHLGQVLRTPEYEWKAIDFEGEPLRPLRERRAPDLALRDIAGMLRSFDYAAESIILSRAQADQADNTGTLRTWKKMASSAFLEGYGELSTEERVLLDALLLDKALYEVSYEVLHRPRWVRIPLLGLANLLGLDDDAVQALSASVE
ncbi:MAG: hypothetical protein SPI12_02835 [Actinomycetaceae bacterium]|nr:hypothetical protein [Actinomycetaceae bacterium]MDY6082784.1 hypothetical protein [Actinomycetaceae bacterium]